MLQLTEDKQPVLEPFEYVRQVGGKKIRLCMGMLVIIGKLCF